MEKTEWQTTTTLLQRLGASDEAAWAAFLRRFRDPVTRWGMERGLSGAEAEDLAQESLLAFVTRLRAGDYERGRGRLGAWLFGIVKLKFREVLRRRKGPNFSELGETPPEPTTDPSAETAAWERSWQRSLFVQCLAQVRREARPDHFAAFVQVTLDGRSAGEVAETLGISRNTVFIAKHRIARRLAELRQELDDCEL